jgi:hypothetical protein
MNPHQNTSTSTEVADPVRTDDGDVPTFTEEQGLLLARVEDAVEMTVVCSFEELPVSTTEWEIVLEHVTSRKEGIPQI